VLQKSGIINIATIKHSILLFISIKVNMFNYIIINFPILARFPELLIVKLQYQNSENFGDYDLLQTGCLSCHRIMAKLTSTQRVTQ